MESYSIPKPWGRARIDYSAVNEYVHAHYNDNDEKQQQQQYFPQSITEEHVYNARGGVYNYNSHILTSPSLETCGFTVIHDTLSSNITDWTDWDQLCQTYFPQLDQSIRQTLHRELRDASIQHLLLWHPMLRGTDLNITTRVPDNPTLQTASVASLVHIDTDIGALTLSQLLDLLQNNAIAYSNSQVFCRSTLQKDIQNGCRFLILNAWRNADTTTSQPVSSHPLGIYTPRYDNDNPYPNTTNNKQFNFFPLSRPNPLTSHWYTFPDMSVDECLFFKQYDRDGTKMSDLWHCALNILTPQQQQRRSFDVRAFVVFKEKVSPTIDRWSGRHPSTLTLEESGCFCDSQAQKRSSSLQK